MPRSGKKSKNAKALNVQKWSNKDNEDKDNEDEGKDKHFTFFLDDLDLVSYDKEMEKPNQVVDISDEGQYEVGNEEEVIDIDRLEGVSEECRAFAAEFSTDTFRMKIFKTGSTIHSNRTERDRFSKMQGDLKGVAEQKGQKRLSAFLVAADPDTDDEMDMAAGALLSVRVIVIISVSVCKC
jgi:hypothetical protein